VGKYTRLQATNQRLVKEPEMDGDLIDAVLKPFLDQLPMVSDERDIDEPDADEEVVFKTPIVGGSASLFSQRKLRSHLMNTIHAVEFKLDGSGVVNILDTDVTRDPKKLELRKESTSHTEDGPVIIRRYDLTDEEHHRQMEKEIFEEVMTLLPPLRLCPRPSRKLRRKRKRRLLALAGLHRSLGTQWVSSSSPRPRIRRR